MQKMEKLIINIFTESELVQLLKEAGFPGFRGKQIFQWLHRHLVSDFAAMTNLPGQLIDYLQENFTITQLVVLQQQVSKDGTVKYLFQLPDGQTIETVLIPEGERNTVCVSSQVGCAMGCTFCATGEQGFARNLNAAEIAGQIEFIAKQHQDVTNIVYMGMGEPLLNYSEVIKSIEILNHPSGLNIGMRRFTISTCGIVPQICQLALEQSQVGLAVSLHAASDQKRQQIMPITKKYPLATLLDACRFYVEQTNRRITFEYTLIKGFNDSLADLDQLVQLLAGLTCHVNIIPVNPVNAEYQKPDLEGVKKFTDALNQQGISASIRKERGSDIQAACGQLRRASEER